MEAIPEAHRTITFFGDGIMRVRSIQILAVMIALASAAKAEAQQSREAVEARTLLKLEDDWARALVTRDSMAFIRLTAPGFIYTENARLMTRNQVIGGVMTGDKVDRAWNQYLVVHEFGPVAVVTGILAVTSRGKTGPYTTRYRFTDTWLNTSGTWQAVAAQDFVIPDRSGQ